MYYIKKIIFVLAGLLIPFGLFSQNDPKTREEASAISTAPQSLSATGQMGVAGILKYRSGFGEEGGMFLDENWKKGVLILYDDTEIQGWKFRYNVRSQQMQYVSEKDTLALAVPTEVKQLEFGGRTFVVEVFRNDVLIDTGYFELIRDGENKLLLRHQITHHFIDQSNDDPSDDTFIYNNMYYVKFQDQEAIPVLLNKKCFYRIFNDKEQKLKAFIKSNKIKCKNQNDLIRVLEYYESL